MPMDTTFVRGLPVAPFHSPLRTRSVEEGWGAVQAMEGTGQEKKAWQWRCALRARAAAAGKAPDRGNQARQRHAQRPADLLP